MKAKLKKTYNYLFRLIIIVATYAFLYQQVFVERNLEEVYLLFVELISAPLFIWGVLFVFMLMFVNWGIETLKWQYQIGKIEKVPFAHAFQAVLTGISVSAFLPNRVGDYFGRVFILEKGNHIEGILITIIGSISQFMATFFLGSIAILFLFPLYTDTSDYLYGYFYPAIIATLIIANFLLFLFYFNVSILSNLMKKISNKRWEKLRKHFKVFGFFSRKDLMHILLLSISRYLVFSFQFFLLLQLFQVKVPIYVAFVLIPVIYLAITAIPTVALSELGVRGYVSIFVIGFYFTSLGLDLNTAEIGIISATSTLWLINIVLPAIAGTFFVFRLKFFRKNNKNGK